ncbi:MAG: hypothetical protein KAJ19_11630, partial [Gammaproteobacteria bacterium]|nr:hypothetical protein [Gammaproteobacteria bacterium]
TLGRTADDPLYVWEMLLDSKWQASTAYDTDGTPPELTYIYPTRPNDRAYRCISAGTSGTTEPTWPTTLNDTVNDGTVTWRCEANVALEKMLTVGLVDGEVKAVMKTVLIADATIGTAKIQDAIITTAKIDDLAVTTGKIADLTISMAKITNYIQSDNFSSTQGFQFRKDTGGIIARQIVITDSSGNVILSSGTGLEYSYVLNGPPAGADVTGDNTAADTALVDGTAAATVVDNALDGATFTDNDAGFWAYFNAKLQATNISTYMAAAAITTTFIADANIITAHILDANITTLKILGNAVTIPVSSTNSTSNYVTFEEILLSVSLDSLGEDVLLIASLTLYNPHSTAAVEFEGRLYQGVAGLSSGWKKTIFADGTTVMSFTFLVTSPGTGTKTYYLNGVSNTGDPTDVKRVTFTALGCLR